MELTCSDTPAIAPASRKRSLSPTTTGRQHSYISFVDRLFIMISGPTPAASPMVMAIIGRYIVIPILSDFVTHTRYFLSDWRHAQIRAAFAPTRHNNHPPIWLHRKSPPW